jgi:protein TonB
MAKKRKDPQSRLKRTLGGGLFRYTLAVSAVLHFGIWGIIGKPWDPGRDGIPIPPDGPFDWQDAPKVRHKDLPPPTSIEMPEPPRAPGGLEAIGGVGEVPIAVPDGSTIFDTITDAVGTGEGEGIGEGTQIIVEENIRVEEEVEVPPWVEVNVGVEYSEAPVIVHEVRPKYPDIARDSRVEGDVTLFVYIDESGNVRNAIVQASPGLPALDEAAIKAAMKCKFKPAKQQGVPVGVWYNIVMKFRLSR